MTDVVIRRCRMRVVRRGGWSWGGSPRAVVETATRALPRLLGRHLARLWPEDVDAEVAEPVTLTVPALPLATLRAVGEILARDEVEWSDGDRAVVARVDDALAVAIEPLAAKLVPIRRVAGSPTASEEGDGGNAPARMGAPRDALLEALAAWHRRGELAAILSCLPADSLVTWHESLLGASATPSGLAASVTPEPALAMLLEEAQAEAPERAAASPDAVSLARLRLRLRTVVRIYVTLGRSPRSPAVRAALDQYVPRIRVPVPDVSPPDEQAAASAPVEAFARPAPARTPAVVVPETFELTCLALPFLLLGPLTAIGWFDAAAASCAALELDVLDALAFGLACKVLAPPERGWRRTHATVRAAAALAGKSTVDESAIARLADLSRKVLAPCDAVLARAVITAHTATEPWIITRSGDDLLLVDAQGLFPAATIAGPDDVRERIGARTSVLVDATAATSALLRALESAGHHFVTTCPPIRNETWQAVAGAPGERYFTNDASHADTIAIGRTLAWATGEIDRTWRALAVERPAAPRCIDRSFETSLSLAASVALGYIAWTLWRDRETSHPRLALERFADLEAHVRVDARGISVRLPLGQRHHDLLSHGLLDDVTDLPWLDGRIVRLVGG